MNNPSEFCGMSRNVRVDVDNGHDLGECVVVFSHSDGEGPTFAIDGREWSLIKLIVDWSISESLRQQVVDYEESLRKAKELEGSA